MCLAFEHWLMMWRHQVTPQCDWWVSQVENRTKCHWSVTLEVKNLPSRYNNAFVWASHSLSQCISPCDGNVIGSLSKGRKDIDIPVRAASLVHHFGSCCPVLILNRFLINVHHPARPHRQGESGWLMWMPAWVHFQRHSYYLVCPHQRMSPWIVQSEKRESNEWEKQVFNGNIKLWLTFLDILDK